MERGKVWVDRAGELTKESGVNKMKLEKGRKTFYCKGEGFGDSETGRGGPLGEGEKRGEGKACHFSLTEESLKNLVLH